jgi:hypothetical protein
VTPARLRWGLLFILFGGLWLAYEAGYLNGDFWWELGNLFPYFFIALGIEKIFTRSRLEVISYISVVSFIAAAVYVSVAGGSVTGSGNFLERTTYTRNLDPAIEQIDAVVEFGENDLTIRDATEQVVYARFPEYSHKPDIDYSVQGTQANLVIDGRASGFMGKIVKIEADEPSDWKLSFSNEVPLFLKLLGKRADIRLNFSTTPLRQLTMDANDSYIYLRMGDMLPQVAVAIEGSDSRLHLRIPHDVGLRVKARDYGEVLRETGMTERDSSFVSENYDLRPNKIDVDLDERLKSLKIDFY